MLTLGYVLAGVGYHYYIKSTLVCSDCAKPEWYYGSTFITLPVAKPKSEISNVIMM